MELPATKHEKIKLTEINQYLTCYLCKGYLIDATTISECLHAFCRSCIIKFLQENSYCPVCELIINKAKPNLKLDKTLQDIVYKLVPELFLQEMLRRKQYYKDYPEIAVRVSPEERGEDTERTIFSRQEMISLSLEYICDDSAPDAIRIPGITVDPEALKNNGGTTTTTDESQESQMKRYLLCPSMCRVEVLKKFVRNKYQVDTNQFFIDILYKRVPLPDHYTLMDIAYIYSWQRNGPMKFFFRIIELNKSKRTDSPTPQFLPQPLTRTKNNGEKNSTFSKKRSSVSCRKSVEKLHNGANKHSSPKKIGKSPKISKKRDKESAKVKPVTETREPDLCKEFSKSKDQDEEGKAIEQKIIKNGEAEIDSESDNKLSKSDKISEESNLAKCKTNLVSDFKNSLIDSKKRETEILILNETETEYDFLSRIKLNEKNTEKEVPKFEVTVDKNNFLSNISQSNKNTNLSCENNISEKEAVDLTKVKTEVVKPEIKSEIPPLIDIKREPISPENNPEKVDDKIILKLSKDFLDEPNLSVTKPQQLKKPVTKSYTSITLNRSENVEIITKIEPAGEGHPNGHHIIKQTIKKGPKVKSPKKLLSKAGKIAIPRLVISKQKTRKSVSPKYNVKISPPKPGKIEPNKAAGNLCSEENKIKPLENMSDNEDEKSKFLKCIELTAKSALRDIAKGETVVTPKTETPQTPKTDMSLVAKKELFISKPVLGQKRKISSPLKTMKVKIPKIESQKLKTPKIESKKPVKIILQDKPSFKPPDIKTEEITQEKSLPSKPPDIKTNNDFKSLIEGCKIPSSLSITIKESFEDQRTKPVAPPVKNFIEILKLPDDSSVVNDRDKSQNIDSKSKEPTTLDIGKLCDNDSEQKVDEDLSEIARSLTEKIPMSTTVSQIVGPKQQFQIPMKTSVPPKLPIQPSPVPDLGKTLTIPTKDSLAKLTPRSPQTFQKIFEESLKKPAEGPKASYVELGPSDQNVAPANNKRNILEIASQLIKKTKIDLEKNQIEIKKEDLPVLKVPIPRLPNPRTLKSGTKKFDLDKVKKLVPQTIASLHSSSLGMNYTVSVGPKSPTKTTKINGVVSSISAESVPKTPECNQSVSPLNELKSIKVEFKVPSPSLGSPKLPDISPSSSLSPRPTTPSPKHSPKSSPLVKHMYAPTIPINQKMPSPRNRFSSLSPNPGNVTGTSCTSPKPPTLSPRPPCISPKPSSVSPRSQTPVSSSQTSPASSSTSQNGNAASMSPNDILEKYNIQNLAQLSASFNFHPSILATNQLAALQQAMLLKHFEMQNRQNWLNMNQGPLLQYEKYLQSLNGKH